jgi:hypothetical protein
VITASGWRVDGAAVGVTGEQVVDRPAVGLAHPILEEGGGADHHQAAGGGQGGGEGLADQQAQVAVVHRAGGQLLAEAVGTKPASYVEFMGYTQPWYSVRGVDAPVGGEMGHIVGFLRDGDRVFLTYSTTGRGNEPVNGSLGLLDMTPYGRREAWEDNPEGWPEAPQADSPVGGHGSPICWYWRSDADGVATWGPTSRPVPQWTRPGATPVESLGRQGHHH